MLETDRAALSEILHAVRYGPDLSKFNPFRCTGNRKCSDEMDEFSILGEKTTWRTCNVEKCLRREHYNVQRNNFD